MNMLNANWAYMVMASVAWSIKAWTGLLLPKASRRSRNQQDDRDVIPRMDFRAFVAAFVNVPAQVVWTRRKE